MYVFVEITPSGTLGFRVETSDCTVGLLDDDDTIPVKPREREHSRRQPPLLADWASVVQALDESGWPWPMLYPILVHPSIGDRIAHALKERCATYPDLPWDAWMPAASNKS